MKINSFEESPSSLLCWFFLLLFIGLCIGSVQWLPDHHFCLQSWQDLDTLSSLEPQQVIPICESRWLLASSPKTLILQLRRILHAILHWPKSTLFGYPDTLPPYARSAPLCLAGPQTPLSTTPGYLTHLSGLCQSLISIWTRLRRKWRAKTRSNLANFIKTRISTSVASILPNNFSMFSSTSRTRPLLYCLQRFLRPGFFFMLNYRCKPALLPTALPDIHHSKTEAAPKVNSTFTDNIQQIYCYIHSQLTIYFIVLKTIFSHMSDSRRRPSRGGPPPVQRKPKPKKSTGPPRQQSQHLQLAEDSEFDDMFSTEQTPTTVESKPSIKTATALIKTPLPHLLANLSCLTDTQGDSYRAANAIMIMNHPVLAAHKVASTINTATTAKKVVGLLTQLGVGINTDPFRDSSTRLYQSLIRMTPDNVQIEGDMGTTKNHLCFILDLEDSQWTGDYAPRHSTIPEHIALTIKTASEIITTKGSEKQRIVSTYNTVDIIPIYSVRTKEMTMQAQVVAPTWFNILNVLIVRPELTKHYAAYIRLLKHVIFSGLSDDHHASLTPRLIITPSRFTLVGDAAQAKKMERGNEMTGLIIQMRIDTRDQEHFTIRQKVLILLLGDISTRSAAVDLCGLPAYLATPLPSLPPLNVQVELIPPNITKLKQHWVVLHGLPREYSPHHLWALLHWIMTDVRIKYIFQQREAINNTDYPPAQRIMPSYVLIVNNGRDVQTLVAAKSRLANAIEQEQLSALPTDDIPDFAIDPDDPQQTWDPALFSVDSPNFYADTGFPRVAPPTAVNNLPEQEDLPTVTRSTLIAVRRDSLTADEKETLPNGILPFPQPQLARGLDILSSHMLGIHEDQKEQVMAAALVRLRQANTHHDYIQALLSSVADQLKQQAPTEQTLTLVNQFSEWAAHMRQDQPGAVHPPVEQSHHTRPPTPDTASTLRSPPRSRAGLAVTPMQPPRPAGTLPTPPRAVLQTASSLLQSPSQQQRHPHTSADAHFEKQRVLVQEQADFLMAGLREEQTELMEQEEA